MFTLVIGGAASGKSGYAESLIALSDYFPRYYIATMEPLDTECHARIEKHRKMRAEKRFFTIECYTGLAGLRLPERGAVLLDCLGNLVANELYSPAGAGTEQGAMKAVVDGVDALLPQCGDLIVVSNEVFSAGDRYAPGTDVYLRALAGAHRALAQRAGRVCEVVCGLPQYYKGGAL